MSGFLSDPVRECIDEDGNKKKVSGLPGSHPSSFEVAKFMQDHKYLHRSSERRSVGK